MRGWLSSGLAAAALSVAAGCGLGEWFTGEETAVRVDRAVEEARDPVELGGERGVPGSAQLLDSLRARGE